MYISFASKQKNTYSAYASYTNIEFGLLTQNKVLDCCSVFRREGGAEEGESGGRERGSWETGGRERGRS